MMSEIQYEEQPLVKTKIIATVGPASDSHEMLGRLIKAGVDLFRLNFAHGGHDWLAKIVQNIHEISKDSGKPIGILGDLSGPKIRLGVLPGGEIKCHQNMSFRFIRGMETNNPQELTCTYEPLIEDLRVGDPILLADGMVAMRVVGKSDDGSFVDCVVEREGIIRSKQGVNLPGVQLSTPSLTEKDLRDLAWAVEHGLDYIGLSFVRSADDIKHLNEEIDKLNPVERPHIVAKIEKIEAVSDIEQILKLTDAVMVARGDLGVEVDIERVPIIQKRIIHLCNQSRVPVITATQMLDSMQFNTFPTRAEASDVANAVLDGSDAVMLSGETAVGVSPMAAVEMMSRIVREAARILSSNLHSEETTSNRRLHAREVTEAVTLGAGMTAEKLDADLMVTCTHEGKTAMSLSKQRRTVPTIALTDRPATARRMTLYWGVTSLQTDVVDKSPQEILKYISNYGKKNGFLSTGSQIVLISGTDWASLGHDMLLVHEVK
ncbi:MAG: pyruvate kinase [Planctomycetes bacterium]|nr:pyruvate kinase [Planctomycetota bacterium]MCH9724996.1 pyruvate kinase [Planctomycetota bacterium]MCH9777543.1 pyruvate kinase [Planctomycetota bacterium]MCH9791525.1 pyruvate kinase [Planctomycetota bacterium]MDF1742513.1 pyruvate kinase [Gimesia sp.]